MPPGSSDAIGSAPVADLEHVPKVLVFLDVVDSTRLIESDERRSIRRWLDYVETVETAILPAHEGRLVNRLGDGLFLEFDDAVLAVRAAMALRGEAARLGDELPRDERIVPRIGMDVGEVVPVAGGDLLGHHVNRAARLMELARPGEIIASAAVRDLLSSELDCEFEDMGNCWLRNVSEPVRTFRVHPRGTTTHVTPVLRDVDLKPTIAVVPFLSRNQAPGTFALGEIIAEDIIVALSRSADMNVISRLSTTGFRMRGAGLAEIGNELNAEFVLSGTYGGNERRLILDVELAEVRSGRVLWADRLRESVNGVLMGPELVDTIAAQIQRAILQREIRRALSHPMPTLQAYTLLIGAVALMHRLSPGDFETARRLLETLIERAPHQPAPQAWMARWHVLKVQQGWSESPEREAALAQACTRRALDIDPENVQAMIAEGFVLTNLLRRLDEAQDLYDDALSLNPNDAVGRLLHGTLHAFKGEGTAAVRETEHALHLSPLDPHRFFFLSLAASASIAAGDNERALRLADRSLRANRLHTSTLRVKAVAEMRLGKEEAARHTIAELRRLQPELTVSAWLRNSPSSDYPVGREFAATLAAAGLPE